MEAGAIAGRPAYLNQPHQANAARVANVATDFEAVVIHQMLKPMFEDIKPDALFGGGSAEQHFQSLMLQEYGKIISQSGGIGLADHVRDEILRLQEGR